jgi:peptide methionine sulfoxide reductase MsrB
MAILCVVWLPDGSATESEPNAAGGNPDALYQRVVQGIRENCRKMECGVLTWQAERKESPRGTDEYRQERVSGQMWQQGEKVAVRVTWQDTHGNATTKREGTETTAVNVYDGKEYRGMMLGGTHMVLRKEPPYDPYAHYLNTCGWPGHLRSIVKELEKSQSDELVETTWSVVEVDGAERIKLRKRWIAPAFPDTYKDFYFDPAKGCMLAQTEFYRNEKLEGTSAWRLEEVLEGMWFPVERTGRSIVYFDGQVYDAEVRLAIDPNKSSFNDRSAIPDGTFKLEITDDIKTIADHRAGDPPLLIDRRESERLTDAEPDDTASDPAPTLEDVIRSVKANEEKLSLIKMDFRTDFSSEGEPPDYPRRHPGAGGRLPEVRYEEVQWAQDGIRQRFVHSFFNQDGRRICQINVVDGETCKVGDWPELKRGTIRDVSGYSRWMVNFAAQLSYRPFYHPEEGAPLLSELLATAELLSDVSLQQRNGRDVSVLDIRSGRIGCRRLYIDTERGVMVRWELYSGTPDSAGARLLQCLESTRFQQTENGGWLPVEGRTTHYDDGYTQFKDIRVDVNSISVDRADIPDSLFHLEYPEHTILSNRIRRDSRVRP